MATKHCFEGPEVVVPIVYTVPEIAALLGINRVSAYELAKQEGFPAVRIGRRIVIPKEAFFRWLEKEAKKR